MVDKHTPGPWSFHLVRVQRDITCPQGGSVAYTSRGRWNYNGDGDAEDHANARLIAAAPELLLALQIFVGHAKGRSRDENFFVMLDRFQDAAEAAIAKATGSTS